MTRANGPGRIATVLRWPLGIAVVSWRYMWRTTPCIVQRGQAAPPTCRINGTAVGSEDGRQGFDVGSGPLLHRTYTVRIAGSVVSSTALIERVEASLDRVSPEMAVFRKVRGDTDRLQPGDEFVVRVPGPWDGPVRVVHCDDASFRLATLDGHVEAGQIEFRAR